MARADHSMITTFLQRHHFRRDSAQRRPTDGMRLKARSDAFFIRLGQGQIMLSPCIDERDDVFF